MNSRYLMLSTCVMAMHWWGPAASAQPVLNIEIDYMVDATHSHQPQPAEIAAVVQMFACHGITLNVVVDEAIPHVNTIRCVNLTSNFWTCDDPDSFLRIRNAHFGHAGLPGWHYCVFGHDYDNGSGTGSSGIAELPGSNFLVTLGSFAGSVGTPFDRAATLAHEFGHNLGLRHGGINNDNYKPNYASIMNYHYQLTGVRRNLLCFGLIDFTALVKDLDYSNGRFPTLDESALDEHRGIGIHNVDWNCSGVIDPGSVAHDLNARTWCTATGPLSAYSDFNDWAVVQGLDMALSEAPAESETVTCITAKETEATEEVMPLHIAPPGSCPAGQPVLSSEPCTGGLMIWVDSSYAGWGSGTGDDPYSSFLTACGMAPDGSVLYLQPGNYSWGGGILTLSRPVTLAGPGVATIAP